MKHFGFILILFFYTWTSNAQNTDTIIAIVPKHTTFSYFTAEKIDPFDFFLSNDTLYYNRYKKNKLKTGDSVLYTCSSITNKIVIFRRPNGKKVFIGSWNYESIYGKIFYFNREGNNIIKGEMSRNHGYQKIGKWYYYYSNGKIKKEVEYKGEEVEESIKIGVWKTYNKKGKLIKEVKYN